MHIQFYLSLNQFLYRLCLPVAIMGLSVALVMVISLFFNNPPIQAQQGVLDLSGWDTDKQESTSLNGEWAFVWNELLPPEQATLETIKAAKHTLKLPDTWNGRAYDGHRLPGHGQATLLLALTPPANTEQFVLKVPMLTNQFQLWINGELKVTDPSFGSPFALSSENEQTRYISFSANEADNNIILMFHLINNRHRDGGMWESLFIASKHNQEILHSTPILLNTVVIFLLGCVSFLTLAKAAKEQQSSLLYLAIFTALMALRGGVVNERVLFSFFEIQDWEIQQTLEYLFLYASIPLFALYLGHRFPNYFPPILHWITAAICSALILLVLITPASVYSHSAPVFQAVVLVYLFLWLGTMSDHIRRNQTGAIMLFTGGLVFIVAGINDILFTNNLISSTNTAHMGALIFVLFAFFSRRQINDEAVAEDQATTFVQANPIIELPSITTVDTDNSKHPLSPLFNEYKGSQSTDSIKRMSVATLKYALMVWEEQAGKDKLALADESKLWRITNDGGTLKTRTFDKYLREDLLPKNPRYNTVAKTLRFVAAQENTPELDKQWLGDIATLLSR